MKVYGLCIAKVLNLAAMTALQIFERQTMIGIYTTQVDENKKSIEENLKKIQENQQIIQENQKRICENKEEIEKLREEYRWLSESSQARLERINKRLVIIIMLLLGMLIGTNAAWIIGR